MSKRSKKPKKETLGTISQIELIKNSGAKLNKGTDQIVRQGTGVHESKRQKKNLQKKTTRQYLSDYGKEIKVCRL